MKYIEKHVELPQQPMIKTKENLYLDVQEVRTLSKRRKYYFFRIEHQFPVEYFGHFVSETRIYARTLTWLEWLFLPAFLWLPHIPFPRGKDLGMWRYLDVTLLDGSVSRKQRCESHPETDDGHSSLKPLIERLKKSRDY